MNLISLLPMILLFVIPVVILFMVIRRDKRAMNDEPAGLEPTWPRVLACWWLFWWRGMVGGGIIGLGLSLLLRGLIGVNSDELFTLLSGVLAFLWSIVVVRMVLRHHYRDFQIVLVPISREGGER